MIPLNKLLHKESLRDWESLMDCQGHQSRKEDQEDQGEVKELGVAHPAVSRSFCRTLGKLERHVSRNLSAHSRARKNGSWHRVRQCSLQQQGPSGHCNTPSRPEKGSEHVTTETLQALSAV